MDPILAFIAGAAAIAAPTWLGGRFFGFAAQSPDDYATGAQPFDIKRHLNGAILCEGVIFGPTGRVTSRFVADMNADWDGDSGRISEHFRYASGETQDRQWRLTLMDGGRIQAEADDLTQAGQGEVSGDGLRMRYRIRLPDHAGGHVLDVVDWMYLLDNGTIMNRSQFRKYGIKVAELVASMRPAGAADKAREAA